MIRKKIKYNLLPQTLFWLLLLITGFHGSSAQESSSIQWLTFEQLDDSLKVNPKKVFIDFYADWCTNCRKMDRETFQNLEVASILNNDFYAVRMNIESPDTVFFGKQVFVNERIKKPNPVHQIALLMASQKGKPFSLPAMVMLNANFEATARYFQYLNAAQMMGILNQD